MDLGEENTKGMFENLRRMILIISMFVVGILLLVFKLNVEYWRDNFGTYVTTVVGISTVLLIVCLLLLFVEIKRFLRYELLGFIFLIIAAAILLVYPASPALDLGLDSGSGTGLIFAGAAVAVIAGIILARYGGYFTACIVGLTFQVIFAGYYPMMSPEAVSFHPNAITVSNMGIGFLILSFVLLIYHDLKFYYLTTLIKQTNRLRKEKKYEEALKICDKSLLIYPYFVTGLNNKGNILYNLKKPKEAIEYYNKAITINPSYKHAQNNLEAVQRKAGRALGL
jgi:tetratricopeptide (TPR) repeat protein